MQTEEGIVEESARELGWINEAELDRIYIL